MKNIPKTIYLQIGDDDMEENPISDFNSLAEVTWCEDMQHDSDIEYVLAGDKDQLRIEGAIDVLHWLDKNPLEWDLGRDVDDIIREYLKSRNGAH